MAKYAGPPLRTVALRLFTDKQTNKQTDKQTNATDYITPRLGGGNDNTMIIIREKINKQTHIKNKQSERYNLQVCPERKRG